MKTLINLCFLFVLVSSPLVTRPQGKTVSPAQINMLTASSGPGFVENKGQLTDDQNRPVPSILFKAGRSGVDIYITEKGITYVFLKSGEEDKEEQEEGSEDRRKEESKIEYCRADMDLTGANIRRSQIEFGDTCAGVNNYFLAHCPKGIMNVHSYKGFTIRNVYPGIDWQWSISGTKIEQDFIVSPGADASLIKMKYHWAGISLHNKGHDLHIFTPLGMIREGASKSFCGDKEIDTRYILNPSKKEVAFLIADYDHSKTLRIDPPLQLAWGTYFRGSGPDGLWAVCTDRAGNTYSGGEAQVGSYPTLNPGGGAYFRGVMTGTYWDANICKFGPANNLIWCTLYGGNGVEQINGIDVDESGNLYFTNYTTSTDLPVNDPAGGAYYQGFLRGFQNAFITKFRSNGALSWATYFGNNSQGNVGGKGTDLRVRNGKVCITGMVDSAVNLPLYNPAGGAYYQSTHTGKTAFIGVFDTSGHQLWTSYLGGQGIDEGWAVNIDSAGNYLVAGRTSSANFPTLNPGGGAYFQAAKAGGFDGFIAKFSPQFVMLYSSYWGGSGDEAITNLGFSGGDIYISGVTTSSNLPIINPGGSAYFSQTGGLFMNRFRSNFTRIWGTCYAGGQFWANSGNYNSKSMAIDTNGNAVMVGSYQTQYYNPGNGAYYNTTCGGMLVAFNSQNQRIWATSLGSVSGCFANAACFGPTGDLYVVGEVQGPSITYKNPGNGAYFDTTASNSDDGFIARFQPFGLSVFGSTASSHGSCTSCSGYAVAHPVNGTAPYSYHWSNNASTDSISGLCPGTYYVTVSDQAAHTMIDTVVISALTVPTVNLGHDTSFCQSTIYRMNAGNAGSTYHWSNGTSLSTLATNQSGNYSVTVTNPAGCVARDSVSVTYYPAIRLSDTIVPTTCGQNNGSATVATTAGTGPFTYHWSTLATSQTVTNLPPDTYYVTVTGLGACQAIDTITIDSSHVNAVNLTSQDPSICPGDSTQLCAPAGYLSYVWNTSQTTPCIYADHADSFYVTLIDSNHCTVVSHPFSVNVFATHVPTMTQHRDTLWASGGTSYQWYLDGNSISGATSSFYIYTLGGLYSVVVTDSNGCSVRSANLRPEPLGIDDQTVVSHIRVYPNPTSGVWHLEADESCIGSHMEIFDVQGRLIFEGIIQNMNSEIELQAQSGVYLIRINVKDVINILKLVKM